MDIEIDKKINEIAGHVCADLGIPNDPYSSTVDPRAQIIANGLIEMAEFVSAQATVKLEGKAS